MVVASYTCLYGTDSRFHLKMKCENKDMIEVETYSFIDTFAEDGKHEDSCNRWCEVAGDGLDVVKELTTTG